MCCARDLDREGIGERHFPETVEAASGAGVTGVKVGAKGNQVVVRAQAPQSCDPFRRFPVEHTRIGQTRQCEDRRIALRAHVLIGRVGQDCSKCRGVAVRVAPFWPFRRRERQRFVEHGVEHVDKRHSGDQAGVKVRPHIADRADQGPASGAAFGDDRSRRAPTAFAEILARCDEIGKRVYLLGELAFAIPAPALLVAATHMRDRVEPRSTSDNRLLPNAAGIERP